MVILINIYCKLIAFPLILIVINTKFAFNFEIKSITKIKIKLENGQLLIGNRKTADNNKIVYEFLGVPFAQIPIGEKRFEFPHRLDDILPTDEYDATQHKHSCSQIPDTTFNRTFNGAEIWNPQDETSEDCLYMNIWVPIKQEYDLLFHQESSKSDNREVKFVNLTKQDEKKLTSLFWIYGGSFITGTINLNVYDGTVISLKENIIIVSANYRLGAFGFLYYNSSRIPGNAGLMDQLLAIEWYKTYYEHLFNAQGICLFGESAGSMSIHFHALNMNEKTKGLFNCAIIQSGNAYLDLTYRNPVEALEMTEKLAELTNCTNQSIIDCLKRLDKSILLENQGYFYDNSYVNRYLPMPFIPTTDFYNYLQVTPFHSTKEVLMRKYEAMKNISFLSGINNDEGGFFLFYAYLNKYYNLTHVNKIEALTEEIDHNQFIANILTELLQTKNNPENSDLPEFSKCLIDLYRNNHEFYDPPCEINVWKKISKIVGDIIFSCPTIKLFESLNSIKARNNYFYRFSYSSSKSNPWPSWIGTTHGMICF